MKWQAVRDAYPNQWVLMEALESHSHNGYWCAEDISVVASCGTDDRLLWEVQTNYKTRYPQRNFFFYHTANERIQIQLLDRFHRPLTTNG